MKNAPLSVLLFLLLVSTSCATTLKQEHIRMAIDKISPALESCVQYHTRLKPNEQFRTKLELSISQLGKPQNINLSGIGNKGLRQCLNSQVKKLKFNIPASREKLFSQNLVFKIKS